ncbi:pheromone A receptor-domain-containing protein [Hypoxylon sp. FL1284]|nr:pheromone A receptor-domain-containing protein [Hypoxylon sp. FL1284]
MSALALMQAANALSDASSSSSSSSSAAAAALLDQRLAPNPGLQANLALRVILAAISTVLCWVPLRLLLRNGDTSAVALLGVTAVLNLFAVINALAWRSDAWDGWWDGAGLCDVEVYLQAPLYTAYAASVFSVVYRLAARLRLRPASPVAGGPRRARARAALLQAAVIVPVPVFQLLFTYFGISQRYKVGTLVGCMPVYDVSWPRVLVYEIPNPLFVFASIPYAYMAWKRYRAIVKSTRDLLTGNSTASARAREARCRLYNMSLLILIVYMPVSIYYMAENIKGAAAASFKPYSYDRIHHGNNPYPWDAILFVPSWKLPSAVINQAWIAISTNVVIIAFYGTTRDGLDMYRRYAVALGLARCFPRLKKSGNAATNTDGTQQSWIELESREYDGIQGAARRARRPADPYPLLDTGTDTSFSPEPLLIPGRPLPKPPQSPMEPPPSPLTAHFHIPPGSPLGASQVIESLIPERKSSLSQSPERGHGQQVQSALRAPASDLPRITEFPDLGVNTRKGARSGGRDIISPWVSGGGRRGGPSSRSPTSPAAGGSSSSGHVQWLPSRAGTEGGACSPRTVDSALHKTSRDVVQPRNMIGGWSPPTSTAPAPVPEVNWPFLAGTALTSGTPSPPLMEERVAATGNSSSKGKKKQASKKDEDEEDDDDSFIRHRDDPPEADPWDSAPTRLAPGLEAIRRHPGRRTRIPRTVNVQFDQYVKPKAGKKPGSD